MTRLTKSAAAVVSEKTVVTTARAAMPCIAHALCDGCGICIARCPTRAMVEPGNSGCAKCVQYCITMEVPCLPAQVVVIDALCDGCGICAAACPHQAISIIADSGRDRAAGE
jgi:Pyruvate/2-oxoacid:ferredoxin oxidoreductase delta subunit